MRRLAIQVTATAICLLAFAASIASAAAPTIVRTSVSKVTTESAILGAEINPQGKGTFYRFEYGPQDCSLNPCTAVPLPEGQIPAGSSPVAVSTPVVGLTVGTTYHLRVIATNGEGEAKGTDRTFATLKAPLGGLPDSRAYEQASPVKKNAADARGRVAWAKASANGDRVSFLSTSGIPGGVGEQELPAYLSSRGSASWSTQGLLPPASLGTEAYVRGWLPDLSQVFDFATNFGTTGDGTLVARSSDNGSLTQIVGRGEGLDSSTKYAGASADGSEVLFEANAKLACCEAAVAGKSNVYLWNRDSDQISLVSVLNDEASPPAGAFAGPYDWMLAPTLPLTAKSGGSARNYYTQDEHAISADGKSVYFTAAGSGALYQRINPSAAQSPLEGGKCKDPALACTLQLSTSHKTPPDPLGSRPAAFMAATPDGSTAFFASPEELTDDANTGPDQPAPAIVQADIDGDPIEASSPIAAAGIAVDGAHIYWTNPAANTIGRADLDGKNPDPIFITVPPLKVGQVGKEKLIDAHPQYVAVDGEYVYWTSEGEGNDGEGTIGRAELNGTPAIDGEWIKGASRPKGIAVNATNVFWANAGSNEPVRGIGRAELGGGGVEQTFIKSSGTELPEGVTVNTNNIFWTTRNPIANSGFLLRADLNGVVEKFVGAKPEPRGVAVNAGHVYWASQSEEAIGRANLELEERELGFVETSGRPKGLALDASHLYWSVNGESVPNPGNDLYRYQAKGEVLSDLTPDTTDPNGAEVKGVLGVSTDGKRVYVAANGDLDGTGPGAEGGCRGEFGAAFGFTGQCSLYLLEESAPGAWSTSLVTRLNAAGDQETSNALDWVGRGGAIDQHEKSALASADGATLVFRSQQKLSAYDNEGVPEFYRYQVGVPGIACITCNPSGEAPSRAPRLGSIGLSALFPQADPAYVLSRNLSADGNRFFFESTDPLVSGDVNGKAGCEEEGAALNRFPSCLDVYEWEAKETGSCKEDVQGGGCLYLLSTGTSPQASFFADASTSGDDAFIATRSAGLVGQDKDQLQDVFDVRVKGGLAAQNQVPTQPCEGVEACHGPASAPPAYQSPPSATLVGPPNPRAARHHKKAAKHKKHHKKHQQRKAKTTGRASR